MVATQTSIINKALALLGTQTRITAPNDGSPAAVTFAALWDDTRDEVLAAHPWNCAIGRAACPRAEGETPANGWAAAYELPPDFLRWLPWRPDDASAFAGEQEGDFLLADSGDGPLHIRYIRRVVDVTKWAVGMRAAMAAKLARYAAKAVTGQSGMIDRMEQLYQDELAKAKAQDGLATGTRDRGVVTASNWLGARRRGYGA